MKIENDYLILDTPFKNKKITATSFYGLIGGNKFKPKGDYLLGVLGLLKEPFDVFYTDRGEIAEKVLNQRLIAGGYETKTWNKYEINFDNFPKNKEFGGMIDIAITKPFRCVVECKSKNIADISKIKRFPNLEQENQALFYGYMSKCDKTKIIYVFFTNEQENLIRQNEMQKIDLSINNFTYYEKDLILNAADMESKMQQALNYKLKCINEKRIPLTDISEKALGLMGISK